MKYYNIKQNLLNDKGITLSALVITIVVMIILAAVTVNYSTDALDSTTLNGFYTELEIIQKRVDDIATTNENYSDASGKIIYLKEQGKSYANLNTVQQNIIVNEIKGLNLNPSTFKYFTANQLEDILGLKEMQYNVFIDFNSRTVIAEKGVTIKEKTYRILKNNIYFVEQDTTKNEGNIELTYDVNNYGKNAYKVIVKPTTVGNLNANGTLRYKKTTSKYWETATNLEIILKELTQYNIEYKDSNGNTISEIIELKIDEYGNLTYNKVAE